MQLWAEDVNKKGGILGRPVELVYYDDQTKGATVPGIYTKLLDVDKVNFVVSGYGTNRSEEHTSELQSLAYLVCRLLLEKKNHRPAAGHRHLPAGPRRRPLRHDLRRMIGRPPEKVAPALRPGDTDDVLEGPRLTRISVWCLVLSLALALFIFLYWTAEPSRMSHATVKFADDSFTRGQQYFALPTDPQ